MRSWINWWNIQSFFISALVLSCFVILEPPKKADAATYYVSTARGANDSNPGTLAAPFRTLGKGASVLSPGDTLFVRGGSYLGGPSFQDNIPNGISWSEPITIKAYQSEVVTITAPINMGSLYFNNESHHIIVDGFVFDVTGGTGGIATGSYSHDIRIMNSEIKNATKSGILTATGSSFFEFINLDVHHNGTDGIHDHGFYLSTGHHVIKNSKIHHNCSCGITIHSESGQKPSDNLVIGNRIYENSACAEGGAAINVSTGGARNQIINNLFWGNRRFGIRIEDVADTKVINNTVVYNGRTGIFLVDKNNRSKNSYVANNIVSMNGTNDSTYKYQIWIMSGHPTTMENNLLFHTDSTRLFRTDNPNAELSGNLIGASYNPKFLNSATFNLRVQEGSFAIDAGKVISEVKDDVSGTLRNIKNTFDIGAYVFNDNSFLDPPSNLRRIVSQ